MLRCDVGGHHRRPLEAGERRGVDDVTVVLFHETRYEGSKPVDHAHQVHADGPVPTFERDLPRPTHPAADPGVVADDVCSVEPGERGRGERLDLSRVGNVALEAHCVDAAPVQLLHGVRQRTRLDIGERDVHAAVGEDVGERAADTTRPAGDGADLAGEVLHLVVLLSQWSSRLGDGRAVVRPYRTCRSRFELQLPGFVSYPSSAT